MDMLTRGMKIMPWKGATELTKNLGENGEDTQKLASKIEKDK